MFLLALLAVICTGVAVSLWDTWGPLYRLNLVVHPLLGLLMSGYILRYMVSRIEVSAPSLSVKRWVIGPALASLLCAGLTLVWSSVSALFVLTLAQVFLYGLGAWRLASALTRRRLPKAVGIGYALFGFWNLTLFSGVAILALFWRGGVSHLFTFHALVGALFVGVLLLFLVVIGVGGLERFNRQNVRQTRPWAIVVKLLVAAGLLALGVGLHEAKPVPEARIALSTIPLSQRAPEARQVHFELDGVSPKAMALSTSCLQDGGCHSDLAQSYLHSNHALGMRTPHMKKSLELLAEEESPDDWKICAGCHAPAALFDASLGPDDFHEEPALSCVSCHLISEVAIDPNDERRSTVTHRAPKEHLGLFIDDAGYERVPGGLNAALIKLSPLSHGRMFTTPLTGEDLMCAGCHHQRIPFEPAVGIEQPRCKDCHLPSTYDSASGRALRDHFSAGAAIGVPALIGDELAVERIRRWIAGEQRIALKGWEYLWDIRRRTHDAPPAATWVKMFHVAQSPLVAGQEYRFRVQSSNVGMNHDFPAGEFSMSETWLEVRVSDSVGNVLFHVGKLDASGSVPADAPRLGGKTVDAAGDPIKDFRLWHTKRKLVDAVIAPRLHRDDDFAFRVPKSAVSPITITGTWNYRKHSRALLDWAYGSDQTLDPVAVGQLNHVVPLDEPAEAP